MSDWRSVLRSDPIDWLLENDNPSVRYYTLTDILETSERNSNIIDARTEIMKNGVVPQILAKQESEGYWVSPERFYAAKYRGSAWQLLVLAELGADGNDERIQKACEFILSKSQDRKSGAFSPWYSGKAGGGRYSGVIPCLTGNMVWSLVRLGYEDDSRIQRGIDWIVRYQRFDDRIKEAAKGWPYDKAVMCFGRHSCHMGVVKSLKALAEIAPEKQSVALRNTIARGVEYILQHHVYKRSHDLSKVSKPGWLHFGFPLMYQTDALEILDVLTKLRYRDDRMQEAVDLVVSKQDEQGRWNLENTFNGKFHVDIEQKGKPSKWITLRALRAIKRFSG